MSPQDSTKRSLLTRIDVYTVLLAVAFLAMCIGCLLLAMELGRYNWDTKAQKAPRAVSLPTSPTMQFAESQFAESQFAESDSPIRIGRQTRT